MKPEQFEMPGIVQGLPLVAPKDSIEQQVESFLSAFQEYGPLVTSSDAARVLGVSPQRVDQMIQKGVFTCVDGLSRFMVPLNEVMARRSNPAPNGRPRKQQVA